MTKIPRGIRNNNPLNIRIGNTWLGEVPNPTDSEFEQFVSVTYGLRAAFCILRRYIRKYNRNTIYKIICAWAPAVENQTEKYCLYVSQRMSMAPDEIIAYEDKVTLVALVCAMARFECGQDIDVSVVEHAYDMA